MRFPPVLLIFDGLKNGVVHLWAYFLAISVGAVREVQVRQRAASKNYDRALLLESTKYARSYEDVEKCSLFDVQCSYVIDGGASRSILLKMLRRRRLPK
jgi:hypothetical protein